MHVIVSTVFFFLGVVLINSAPFTTRKRNLHSSEIQDRTEDSAVRQDNPMIPLLMSRHFIKVRNHDGFCFKRLPFSLAPGTASGFKGWIKQYSSGYLAADEKLYLFFRCSTSKLIRRLRRVRSKRSNDPQTAPPPRPCVNDTVPVYTESESGEGATPGFICPQLSTEEPTEGGE